MDKKVFISELERCIAADSSSPPEPIKTAFTSAELATLYLNGEYVDYDDEDDYLIELDEEDFNDDEDIQVIYIDDNNFSKLEEEEIKNFINSLSIILGTNPYSADEIEHFLSLCKKPKE